MSSPIAHPVSSNPLHEARVERGETLVNVSRATGIPVRELESLERVTSVAHRPDPVRARRNLVAYADHLNLEPAPKPPAPARPILRIIVGGDEPATGRSDFLTQAKPFERFLAQPDVELALDPEWRVGPTQVPGRQLGSVDAAEVNQVVTWLSGIVTAHHLPQKLLILHQFRESMITNRDQILHPSQLAVTFDVDGVGDRRAKGLKYRSLAASTKGFYLGIKLYYRTDTRILQPVDVLRLRPHPDLVIYQ